MKKNLLALAAVLGLLPLPGCRPNNAPVVTELSGPSSGRIDSTYLFVAHAADPDGDAVAIRFDWDNGDTSDWSAPVQSALPVRLSYVWPDGDSYEVRCQARDKRGALSDWSGPFRVFIQGNRPPMAPYTDDWLRICYRDSTYPVLTGTFDPDGQRVRIRCDLGNGDTTAWTDWVRQDSHVTILCSWPAADSYEWRLQAQDDHGAFSDWSEPRDVWVLPASGNPKWTFALDGWTCSCPAVAADGTVYIGNVYGLLYAINTDGTLRWTCPVGGDLSSDPSIGQDGTIYVCSCTGHLCAVNPVGSIRWRCPVPVNEETGQALAADGTVYIGADDSCLYAVNPDGSVKWRCRLGGTISTPPAIAADGTVYVGSGDYLCAVNPDSTLRWRCFVDHALWEGMAVGSDGTVYACDHHGVLHAVWQDGTIRWNLSLYAGLDRASPLVGSDGTIYVPDADGDFTALNPDGGVRWGRSGYWLGPALAADGTVCVGSHEWGVFALKPDGSVTWVFHPEDGISTATSIAPDGTVHFVDTDGVLYALPGTSPLANSPWPKYQHDLFNSGRAGGP